MGFAVAGVKSGATSEVLAGIADDAAVVRVPKVISKICRNRVGW